jgi:hypothetical protein
MGNWLICGLASAQWGMVCNFAFNALTTSSFFELLSHIAKYKVKNSKFIYARGDEQGKTVATFQRSHPSSSHHEKSPTAVPSGF